MLAYFWREDKGDALCLRGDRSSEFCLGKLFMLVLKVAEFSFACTVWSRPYDDDALDLILVSYEECGDDNFERSDHK